MRAVVTMADDELTRVRHELAGARAEAEQARAERDDLEKVATELLRVVLRYPEVFAEVREHMDVLDLMPGPPAV
jgi:phage terminase Nu1 subunit (DNA packaging protein)